MPLFLHRQCTWKKSKQKLLFAHSALIGLTEKKIPFTSILLKLRQRPSVSLPPISQLMLQTELCLLWSPTGGYLVLHMYPKLQQLELCSSPCLYCRTPTTIIYHPDSYIAHLSHWRISPSILMQSLGQAFSTRALHSILFLRHLDSQTLKYSCSYWQK